MANFNAGIDPDLIRLLAEIATSLNKVDKTFDKVDNSLASFNKQVADMSTQLVAAQAVMVELSKSAVRSGNLIENAFGGKQGFKTFLKDVKSLDATAIEGLRALSTTVSLLSRSIETLSRVGAAGTAIGQVSSGLMTIFNTLKEGSKFEPAPLNNVITVVTGAFQQLSGAGFKDSLRLSVNAITGFINALDKLETVDLGSVQGNLIRLARGDVSVVSLIISSIDQINTANKKTSALPESAISSINAIAEFIAGVVRVEKIIAEGSALSANSSIKSIVNEILQSFETLSALKNTDTLGVAQQVGKALQPLTNFVEQYVRLGSKTVDFKSNDGMADGIAGVSATIARSLNGLYGNSNLRAALQNADQTTISKITSAMNHIAGLSKAMSGVSAISNPPDRAQLEPFLQFTEYITKRLAKILVSMSDIRSDASKELADTIEAVVSIFEVLPKIQVGLDLLKGFKIGLVRRLLNRTQLEPVFIFTEYVVKRLSKIAGALQGQDSSAFSAMMDIAEVISRVGQAIPRIVKVAEQIPSGIFARFKKFIQVRRAFNLVATVVKDFSKSLRGVNAEQIGKAIEALSKAVRYVLQVAAMPTNALNNVDNVIKAYQKLAKGIGQSGKGISLPNIKGFLSFLERPPKPQQAAAFSKPYVQAAEQINQAFSRIQPQQWPMLNTVVLSAAVGTASALIVTYLSRTVTRATSFGSAFSEQIYLRFVAPLKTVANDLNTFGTNLLQRFSIPAVMRGAPMAIAAEFDDLSRQLTVFAADIPLEQAQAFAEEIGINTPLSANRALQAILDLAKAGQSFAAIRDILPTASDLASLSDSRDLNASAQFLIAAANGYEKFSKTVRASFDGDALRQVADNVFAIANATTASVDALQLGLTRAAPAARTYGQSLDEVVAFLGQINDAQIRNEEAGTLLRTTLTGIYSEKGQETLKALGIDLFNADGSFRSLNDTIKELSAALAGMSASARLDVIRGIGDVYAQQGIAILTAAGGVDRLTAAYETTMSAADGAKELMLSYRGELDSFFGSVETVINSVLQPFIHKFALPLIRNAKSVVDTIGELPPSFKEAAANILAFGTVAATIVGVLAVASAGILTVVANIAALSAALYSGSAFIGLFINTSANLATGVETTGNAAENAGTELSGLGQLIRRVRYEIENFSPERIKTQLLALSLQFRGLTFSVMRFASSVRAVFDPKSYMNGNNPFNGLKEAASSVLFEITAILQERLGNSFNAALMAFDGNQIGQGLQHLATAIRKELSKALGLQSPTAITDVIYEVLESFNPLRLPALILDLLGMDDLAASLRELTSKINTVITGFVAAIIAVFGDESYIVVVRQNLGDLALGIVSLFGSLVDALRSIASAVARLMSIIFSALQGGGSGGSKKLSAEDNDIIRTVSLFLKDVGLLIERFTDTVLVPFIDRIPVFAERVAAVASSFAATVNAIVTPIANFVVVLARHVISALSLLPRLLDGSISIMDFLDRLGQLVASTIGNLLGPGGLLQQAAMAVLDLLGLTSHIEAAIVSAEVNGTSPLLELFSSIFSEENISAFLVNVKDTFDRILTDIRLTVGRFISQIGVSLNSNFIVEFANFFLTGDTEYLNKSLTTLFNGVVTFVTRDLLPTLLTVIGNGVASLVTFAIQNPLLVAVPATVIALTQFRAQVLSAAKTALIAVGGVVLDGVLTQFDNMATYLSNRITLFYQQQILPRMLAMQQATLTAASSFATSVKTIAANQFTAISNALSQTVVYNKVVAASSSASTAVGATLTNLFGQISTGFRKVFLEEIPALLASAVAKVIAVLSVVQAKIIVFATAIRTAFMSFIATPAGLVLTAILAIGAAVAAIVALAPALNGAGNILSGLGQTIVGLGKFLGDAIEGLLTALLGEVGNFIGRTIGILVESIVGIVGRGIEIVGLLIGKIVDIARFIKSIFDGIFGAIQGLFSGIANAVGGVFGGVFKFLGDGFGILKDVFPVLTALAIGFGLALKTSLGTLLVPLAAVGGAILLIKAAFDGLAMALRTDIFSGIIEFFKSLLSNLLRFLGLGDLANSVEQIFGVVQGLVATFMKRINEEIGRLLSQVGASFRLMIASINIEVNRVLGRERPASDNALLSFNNSLLEAINNPQGIDIGALATSRITFGAEFGIEGDLNTILTANRDAIYEDFQNYARRLENDPAFRQVQQQNTAAIGDMIVDIGLFDRMLRDTQLSINEKLTTIRFATESPDFNAADYTSVFAFFESLDSVDIARISNDARLFGEAQVALNNVFLNGNIEVERMNELIERFNLSIVTGRVTTQEAAAEVTNLNYNFEALNTALQVDALSAFNDTLTETGETAVDVAESLDTLAEQVTANAADEMRRRFGELNDQLERGLISREQYIEQQARLRDQFLASARDNRDLVSSTALEQYLSGEIDSETYDRTVKRAADDFNKAVQEAEIVNLTADVQLRLANREITPEEAYQEAAQIVANMKKGAQAAANTGDIPTINVDFAGFDPSNIPSTDPLAQDAQQTEEEIKKNIEDLTKELDGLYDKQSDLFKDIEKEREEFYREQRHAEEDFNTESIRRLEDHKKELLKLEEDSSNDLVSAVAERDSAAAQNAVRNRNKQMNDAKKAFDQEEKRRREDFERDKKRSEERQAARQRELQTELSAVNREIIAKRNALNEQIALERERERAVTQSVQQMNRTVVDNFANMARNVVGVLGKLFPQIDSNFSTMANNVIGIVQRIGNSASVLPQVESFVGGITRFINQLTTVNPMGSKLGNARIVTGGGGIQIGREITRASGGPTRSDTLYRVGEREPELLRQGGKLYLIPSQLGHITPPRPVRNNGVSTTNNSNITIDLGGITVQGAGSMNPQQLASEVERIVIPKIAKTIRDSRL